MGSRFTVMMQALKNLTQGKHKHREGEHADGQTCQKRVRTLAECLEKQQELSHQVSDDNFIENSADTRHYGISDEEEFQEKCIALDQQNLAHEIQELCSGDQVDRNIGSIEVLLSNISQNFFSKKELGKPVSDKLSKIVNTFLNGR